LLASGENTHIQCKKLAKIGGAKDKTSTQGILLILSEE
jgi:hypothetical protein